MAELVRVESEAPEPRILERAAAILRRGGLVAFPTETVYGLGAWAEDPEAVQRIYRAKGRPQANPLIVHVASAESARQWVLGWDERAERLCRAFWPGPLTLVLERGARIPAVVSAGGQTLALRSPAHPVAKALLEVFGGPIAAPSANRSTSISPTRAEDVEAELGDVVELILDGGPCAVGLESTVLDLTSRPACVLRPGAVTASSLARVLGEEVRSIPPRARLEAPRSPGLMGRHYAPRKPLLLVPEGTLPKAGICLLSRHATGVTEGPVRKLPETPVEYARELYAALRWADRQEVSEIWVEEVPAGEDWSAIRDRLDRAAIPES